MAAIDDPTTDVDALLDAARGGDGDAFRALVSPHLRALHLHCYRMLGSYDDAEEAVQDALLRAWRGLDGFAGRAPLRHWLYRITTTTCLKLIERRRRQPGAGAEVDHLQPYPDALLSQLADADADPAAVVDRRESVALAFIVALQLLPATQRAVLVLHDVLAWSSRDVADVLGTSPAAVNSALQRARATLQGSTALAAPPRPPSARERQVVAAFMRAWQDCDVPALAALLRDDVILTMPPEAVEILGREAVARFFATVPAGGRLDLVRLVVTRANGQPALAAYLPDGGERWGGYGIMVLTVDQDRVTAITGFRSGRLFPAFDLPAELDAPA